MYNNDNKTTHFNPLNLFLLDMQLWLVVNKMHQSNLCCVKLHCLKNLFTTKREVKQ